MKKRVAAIIAGLVISITVLGLNGCSGCNRTMKTIGSDWDGGLMREITVYDANGDILFEQKGKIDVEYDEAGGRILYDDEDGMRHIFYLGSGTVIVNEVDS